MLNFKEEPIDMAVRKMLGKFRLPGESQQIYRIVEEFTAIYHKQNPKSELK